MKEKILHKAGELFLTLGFKIDKGIEFMMFNRPCGASIGEFTKDSPAEKAGLLLGDVITQVDNLEIVESIELVNYMRELKQSREIFVTTKRGIFKIAPMIDEESGNYRIGIRPGQEYCK